ncbi:nitroreductase family protein [Wukongibacter baidiensis]|uniref:nitroreductase family protein n=1 Tax=Wukongibacter baidiensis TaxID=1723361 RepID=UPI003D7F80C8
MDAIFKRRSIRKYESRTVEKEKIELLLKAAMQAPSAGNQQPWEFIVVQNKEMLKNLSMMSPYAGMVAEAPLAIVLLGNKDYMKYPENWEQDMGAATQNLLLQAVELDLGAVWLGVAPLEERMDYVNRLFNLSENIMPYCVVPIGYPKGQENKMIDRFDEERVHYEKY